ncbi:hypothetical protein KRX19_10185 [Cardiobacteriaceae bacterium TAE3-ERU3]|nr:hypothetical protein [Cardiobacteriaceae bacterium TAE3-ERU3]
MDLKEHFNWALIDELGQRLQASDPDFDRGQFKANVTPDLLMLEMKARLHIISTALFTSMDKPYAQAVPLLLTALDDGSHGLGELRGFPVWVIADIVERYGLNQPKLSLQAIHKITQHFTGEFAIRPYLEQHPQYTLETLHAWTDDPYADVRRLVSEGIRPRLPWGTRIKRLIQDPSEIFPLLDKLYDDDSEYVRRSVANNLNDISKDHPELVIARLKSWQKQSPPSPHLDWIIRHACRSLIRAGHPDALALQGYAPATAVIVNEFTVQPEQVILGESFTVNLTLDADQDSALLIDLILHSPSASNKARKRVLKWCRRDVPAGNRVTLSKSWPLKSTTTRQEYPGEYRIELMINGRILASTTFAAISGEI